MNKIAERLVNGIIKENPTFVLMLGMCPTMAVTTSAINGLGMGLSTTLVLVFSNLLISILRNIIPNRVRVPAYIVIVASLVTVVQFLLQGFVPSLYASLGIFIPLIVVNCIILGRAESYASKNPVLPSIFDGVGMGLGFTFGLTCIGIVREILGAGQIFGFQLLPLADAATGKAGYTPITIFVLAPGAFIVLGCLVAVMNVLKVKAARRGKPMAKYQSAVSGEAEGCENSGPEADKLKAATASKAGSAPEKTADAVKPADDQKKEEQEG